MEGTSKRCDFDHLMVSLISFGRGHVPVEGFHCNPGTSLNFNPWDVGEGEGLGVRGSYAIY